MKRVVMFSGGIGSWAAARRVKAEHGTDEMILLFADTMMEDADLYRFIEEAARDIGVPLTRIADGRTPWQVFEDERFIGNSHVDPCSKILKRKLMDGWRTGNCDPAETINYVGIDWTEKHRLERLQKRSAPWRYEAPLCGPPWKLKREMLADLRAARIEVPFLYRMGFAHNNCGGFCCKAGQSHFRLLLRQLPERYREAEAHENRLRAMGINGTILTDRRGGPKRPMTLTEFRERIEKESEDYEHDDLASGCGCAL